jgi:hypothetical protein
MVRVRNPAARYPLGLVTAVTNRCPGPPKEFAFMPQPRLLTCLVCLIVAIPLSLSLVFMAPADAPAQSKKSKKSQVSFINDVAPILQKNCFACHDSKKRKGKLDMTTYENFRKGGDKDDPVTPGKPDESYIMHALTATDKTRMPPKESGEPLAKAQIALIEQWIKEGAKLDRASPPRPTSGGSCGPAGSLRPRPRLTRTLWRSLDWHSRRTTSLWSSAANMS